MARTTTSAIPRPTEQRQPLLSPPSVCPRLNRRRQQQPSTNNSGLFNQQQFTVDGKDFFADDHITNHYLPPEANTEPFLDDTDDAENGETQDYLEILPYAAVPFSGSGDHSRSPMT